MTLIHRALYTYIFSSTACRRILKVIERLQLTEGLPLEEVQQQWIEALWGWFDVLFAALQEWVGRGGGKCGTTKYYFFKKGKSTLN